jgi:hypothetical protein
MKSSIPGFPSATNSTKNDLFVTAQPVARVLPKANVFPIQKALEASVTRL